MALKAITDPKEKDEYRRRLLIEEICITEREFLEDLEVLVKVITTSTFFPFYLNKP